MFPLGNDDAPCLLIQPTTAYAKVQVLVAITTDLDLLMIDLYT